jgi:hypothetical protein
VGAVAGSLIGGVAGVGYASFRSFDWLVIVWFDFSDIIFQVPSLFYYYFYYCLYYNLFSFSWIYFVEPIWWERGWMISTWTRTKRRCGCLCLMLTHAISVTPSSTSCYCTRTSTTAGSVGMDLLKRMLMRLFFIVISFSYLIYFFDYWRILFIICINFELLIVRQVFCEACSSRKIVLREADGEKRVCDGMYSFAVMLVTFYLFIYFLFLFHFFHYLFISFFIYFNLGFVLTFSVLLNQFHVGCLAYW